MAGLAACAGTFAAVAAGWAALGDVGITQIGLAVVASLIGGLLTYLQVRKELLARRLAMDTAAGRLSDFSARQGHGEGGLFELPADVVDFTGRHEHLARLRDLLSPGDGSSSAVMILAIAGKGGVGKTTLAIHAAHQIRPQFPDGQLYVNLRGADNQPLEPSVALGAFLASLGVAPTAVPEGLEEQARLYRATLDGQQMLLVLDNVADEAQVRPLLPGGGSCAVLVTSRRRLTGLDGAVTIDLDVLEPAQAVELLGKIAGVQRFTEAPGAALELAQLCGYLPLAVRIAGARLAAKQHWRPDAYVARLRDEHTRLDELHTGDREVRASLTLSYTALNSDEQRVFRLLGLVPGADFTAWPLAVMLDSAASPAEALLERLVDVQLVDALGEDETGQMRYRLHDLVRVLARDLLFEEDSPQTRRVLLTRVLTGCLRLTQRAATRLGWENRWNGNGRDPVISGWPAANSPLAEVIDRDPCAWFRVERVNLMAAVTDAYDAGLWELTWLLADSLFAFFESSAQWSSFEQVSELALKATREASDVRAEAYTLRSAGITLCFRGRSRDALKRFNQCEMIFATLGDRLGMAYTLLYAGVAHRYDGQFDVALTYLNRCLPIFHEQQDELGTALVMRNIGVIHRHRAHFGEALDYLTNALTVFERRSASLPAALTLYHLGAIHRDHGRLDESIACTERSVELSRRLDNHLLQMTVLRSLGEAHRLAGRFDDALPSLEKVIVIAQELGERFAEAEARHGLGDLYRAQGRFLEATACLAQCLKVLREFNAHNATAEALRSLGRLRHATGDYDQAQNHFNESLYLARQHHFPLIEARTQMSIGALLESRGDHDGAKAAKQQARAIFRRLRLPEFSEI